MSLKQHIEIVSKITLYQINEWTVLFQKYKILKLLTRLSDFFYQTWSVVIYTEWVTYLLVQ